jgi:hypothetical protein
MRPRRKIAFATAVAIALAAIVGALAYFAGVGTGTGNAAVGTLTAPGKPSVPTAGGTVNLSWAAATAGGGTVKYHVERRPDPGSTWTDVCASTDAAPITGTSCSDTPGGGTFVYRVTARYASWHTTGPESDPVTAAVVGAKLVFTTSPQALTAGTTSGTITVERQDASNTPATAGTTIVNLSSTSGAGVFRNTADTTTITSVSITPGNSSASFKYTDTVAGTPTITAADAAAVLTQATQQQTITAAALNKLVFTTAALSGAASSTASLGPATLQRQDQFGNPVTSGSTAVALSSNSTGTAIFSASLNGAGTTSLTITNTNSTVNFFYGDTKAATPTITANAGAGPLTVTQQQTITAAAPSVFQFSNCSVNGGTATDPCPASVIVGSSPGHVDAHVRVLDNFGNTATVTGSPLVVTLSNSGSANYSITANPTIAIGASESGIFTVTHLNTSNNSTTVATTNAGFTQDSLLVSK